MNSIYIYNKRDETMTSHKNEKFFSVYLLYYYKIYFNIINEMGDMNWIEK